MKARRGWAWPLVPLYAAGLAVKDGLRAAEVLKTKKLKWPVVSVGSLSAGGAGKTPVVIALAELLRGRGWDVDVLSRGYGREGSGVERVDSSTERAAWRFGDEPVLIAQATGVPVWVGARRFEAGMAAEANGAKADPTASLRDDKPKHVHLLDDGFQHRELARAMDVVLVTAEDLEDGLLPAGNRREGLWALRRADVVVVREEEREQVEGRVRRFMRAGAPVWTVRRRIDFPGAEQIFHREYGLILFCGIARPEGFVNMVRAEGGRVLDSIAFPDHHRYTEQNVRKLTESCRTRSGDGFVTTEKDAVKLTPELRAQLEATGPLHVARLQATFVDEDAVVRELEARIG